MKNHDKTSLEGVGGQRLSTLTFTTAVDGNGEIVYGRNDGSGTAVGITSDGSTGIILPDRYPLR